MSNNLNRYERLDMLFEKYSNLLYRIALVKLRSREDAEDAVQDAFIKYLSSPFNFFSDSEEKAWLVKVLENRCHDLLRRRNVREYIPIEEIYDLASDDEVSAGVFEMLTHISEKYRTVILLHHLEGFSIDEISKALSLSPSAVKMRLSRGREELKKLIGEGE